MQGYLWKEKRLRAWLLEKDPSDGKMYYVDGPRDPRTGKGEPVPVAGPVPLSPRIALRDQRTQVASAPNVIHQSQTSRQAVSHQTSMPSPAFTNPQHGPLLIVEPVISPVQDSSPTPLGNTTLAPEAVPYTIYPTGYHGHHGPIPAMSSAVHGTQHQSGQSSISSSSSVYLMTDTPSCSAATSHRSPTSTTCRSQHNSISGSSTSSMAPRHHSSHPEPRLTNGNTVCAALPNNADTKRVIIQYLDAKSGTKDLRLCLERDMHFIGADLMIKSGKNKKGKCQAFVTFRTAPQAELAVRNLNGSMVGHNRVVAALDRSDHRLSGGSNSNINSTTPSSGGVVSKQNKNREPIIIDGSVTD